MLDKVPEPVEVVNDDGKIQTIKLHDELDTTFKIQKKQADPLIYIVTREWSDGENKRYSDTLEIGKTQEAIKLNVSFQSRKRKTELAQQQNNNHDIEISSENEFEQLDQEKLKQRKDARQEDDVLSAKLIVYNNILLNSIIIDTVNIVLTLLLTTLTPLPSTTIAKTVDMTSLGILSLIHVFTGYYGTRSGKNGYIRSNHGIDKADERKKEYKLESDEINERIRNITRFKCITDKQMMNISKKTLQEIIKWKNNKETEKDFDEEELRNFIKRTLSLDNDVKGDDDEAKVNQAHLNKDLDTLIYLLLEKNYFHITNEINDYDDWKHYFKRKLNFLGQHTGYLAIGCTIAALAIGSILIFIPGLNVLTLPLFAFKIFPLLLSAISIFISVVSTINGKFELNSAETKEAIVRIQHKMCKDYKIDDEEDDIYERLLRCEEYKKDREEKYYNSLQELFSKIVITLFITLPILSDQLTQIVKAFGTAGLKALKWISFTLGFTLVSTKLYNKKIAQLSNNILVGKDEANDTYMLVNKLYRADENAIDACQKEALSDGFRRLARAYTKMCPEDNTVHTYAYEKNFPKNTKPELIQNLTKYLPIFGPVIGAGYTALPAIRDFFQQKMHASYTALAALSSQIHHIILPSPLPVSLPAPANIFDHDSEVIRISEADEKVGEPQPITPSKITNQNGFSAAFQAAIEKYKPRDDNDNEKASEPQPITPSKITNQNGFSAALQAAIEKYKPGDDNNSELHNETDEEASNELPSMPETENSDFSPQSLNSKLDEIIDHKQETIIKEVINKIDSLSFDAAKEKKQEDDKSAQPNAQPIEEDDTDNSIIGKTDTTAAEALTSNSKSDISENEDQAPAKLVKTQLNVDDDGKVSLMIEPIVKQKEVTEKIPGLNISGISPVRSDQAHDDNDIKASKSEQKCQSLVNLRTLLPKPEILQSKLRRSKSAPEIFSLTNAVSASRSPVFSQTAPSSAKPDSMPLEPSQVDINPAPDTDSDESNIIEAPANTTTQTSAVSPRYEVPPAQPIPNPIEPITLNRCRRLTCPLLVFTIDESETQTAYQPNLPQIPILC